MRRFLCLIASVALSFSGAHACEPGSAGAEIAKSASAPAPDCQHGAIAGDQDVDRGISDEQSTGGFCNGDCNGCTLAAAAIMTEPLASKLEVLRIAGAPASRRIIGSDVAVDPPPPRA